MMNKYRVIFYFLVALLISPFRMTEAAETYKWPVISDVEIEYLSDTSATYTVRYTTISIADSPLLDAQPCVAWRDCIVGTAHRHSEGGFITVRGGNDASFNTNYSWREILQEMVNFTPEKTINHAGGANGSECVDFSIHGDDTRALWDSYLSKKAYPPSIQRGNCYGLPPAQQWCALTTPSITFDFGEVTVSDAEGTAKTEHVNVECTKAGIKYVLKLKGAASDDSLSLNNGMNASFTANGQKFGNSLNGSGSVNQVDIEATLIGTPPAGGGDFSGSGVIVVGYP